MNYKNIQFQIIPLLQSTVEEGGLVPKTMYLPGEDTETGRQHIQLNDQSIYHSVSLSRQQVCRVICSLLYK